MKYFVTPSLEVYHYHDTFGYNYMTKFDAIGCLTRSKPNIAILKKDCTFILTTLTTPGDDEHFIKVAKQVHKNPMTLKHSLKEYGINLEKGDIIIWTKENMMPCSYHLNKTQ